MILRILNPSNSQSFFLFGARGTGKTTLLKHQFSGPDVLLIDLLSGLFTSELEAHPERLEGLTNNPKKERVVIDEIQKIPPLLDEVHRLIENTGQKFILTGSSARKLKRSAANMLAGRAFVFKLFPLTHLELGGIFDLNEVLSFGSLPKIFSFSTQRDKILFLKAYADTYLKEEILIEQLVRKLPPFRKFLELAATQDTELVSYTNIARDINVDPKVVANYYSILEDTLLGFLLEPFAHSLRKRQKHTPKFYWFDTGVRRALSGTVDDVTKPASFEFGSLFESFIINEFHRLLTYAERSFKMSFFRVDEKTEIDLIIERPKMPTYLIEIKSTDHVHSSHVETLKKISPLIKNSFPIVLSRDPLRREIEGVLCSPWQQGMAEILKAEL